jgi:hypothetical protein
MSDLFWTELVRPDPVLRCDVSFRPAFGFCFSSSYFVWHIGRRQADQRSMARDPSLGIGGIMLR